MKRLLLFAVVATLFAACTQDIVVDVTNPTIADNTPETLVVGFEDDDTRIQLNGAQKTVWTKGDLVSVFYRSDANQKWHYQGETGERVGNLKRVENATSTTKTTKTVVIYPYSESYWLNTDSYAIDATLPATQYYAEGSYGVGSNLMVSQSEFTQFSLKSVCGWLKLQLTGDGKVVKSIKFRGNNDEQVAGLIYVDTATADATLASEMGSTDDNNAGGNLVFDDTILTEVTLDCGAGVTLGAEATAFYIALPPQTFDGGITVEIATTDGATMTKSTNNSIVIERNHIQPMTTFEYNGILKPANNEIYYTNGSTTNPTDPISPYAFGSAIIKSNAYDVEKECWVITFDRNVMEIEEDAFYNKNSLKSVIIPDSVKTIGENAFHACFGLESVTIGDGVTTIGIGAFSACDKLEEFNGKFAADNGRCLIKDNTIIAYANASGTAYTILDGVTTIGVEAFSDCDSLTSVIIPDSVTTIGDRAFWSCDSLTSVTIGNSVAEIGAQAFYHCKFSSLTIPDGVTTIRSYAFHDCSNLTSVTIGNGVTTIEPLAFNCSSIKEFKGKFAADSGRCLIMDNTIVAYAEASGTTYTIPDSVKSIGQQVFYFSDITSVTIPDGVTEIGLAALAYCFNLTNVIIPDSVTTIGDYAFDCNYNLTSVTIGDSVTAIGERAFGFCESLKTVYCKPIMPPTGEDIMFLNHASYLKIYVPKGSGNAYKAKQYWSDYADYIYEDASL